MTNVSKENPPNLTILGNYIAGGKQVYTLLDIIPCETTGELDAVYAPEGGKEIARACRLKDFIKLFSPNGDRTINPPFGIILMRAKIEGDHQFLEALVDYQLDPAHREPVQMEQFYFESEDGSEMQSVRLGIRFLGSGGTMNFPLGEFWYQDGIEMDALNGSDGLGPWRRYQFLGHIDGWTLARIQLR